jgi:hypothetical protein
VVAKRFIYPNRQQAPCLKRLDDTVHVQSV